MKQTQHEKILSLLKSKHEVSLPEILALGIAQYNARIKELREQGYEIINRTKRVDGVKHSWFRLQEVEPAPDEQSELYATVNQHSEEQANNTFFEKSKQLSFIG